ncbi:MAG: sugar isomerase domain-containing protein, partial [Clostridia bacterium]|nr:sugar isomerase domain-containing protein [Clostridia bacterium]
MDAIHAYFDAIKAVLAEAEQTQSEKLEAGARMIADATLSGHNLFAFGASHAGLVTLELYYRTGGMATVNPVRAPGLALDVDPATLTSQMERMPGYGRLIVDALPLGPSDILILHSVSGRNHVTLDMAMRACEKGAKVIALTNMRMTNAVSSRHPSGKKLCDAADLVLDNRGCVGDA